MLNVNSMEIDMTKINEFYQKFEDLLQETRQSMYEVVSHKFSNKRYKIHVGNSHDQGRCTLNDAVNDYIYVEENEDISVGFGFLYVHERENKQQTALSVIFHDEKSVCPETIYVDIDCFSQEEFVLQIKQFLNREKRFEKNAWNPWRLKNDPVDPSRWS